MITDDENGLFTTMCSEESPEKTKNQSTSEEEDAVYLVGFEEYGVLRVCSTNRKFNSNNYCSQLN